MLEPNPSVDLSQKDQVLTITLNRPDRYNAITIPMMRRLTAALHDADGDPGIGCIILTATGKGFCAGQDLRVLSAFYDQSPPAELGSIIRTTYNAAVTAIREAQVPVIGAVQGVAAGAGWSLALACDIRIAADSARFVPAFAQLGLIPDLGGTRAMVEAVGYARAMEYALLTDSLTASEALQFGLINRVTPDVELVATAEKLASRITSLPREGVVLTKRALRRAGSALFSDQLVLESWYQSIAASSPAHADRVRSFAHRR